jgi:hypothetical protein
MYNLFSPNSCSRPSYSSVELLIPLKAIVVGCLPSFAVFLQSRRLNVSNNPAKNVNSKITVNTKITIASSRAKSKARTESIMLDDVGEAESQRGLEVGKASFDRSESERSLKAGKEFGGVWEGRRYE